MYIFLIFYYIIFTEILKVNKNVVYELINSGELPVIKGVGRMKISEEAFYNYIKKIEGTENEDALCSKM